MPTFSFPWLECAIVLPLVGVGWCSLTQDTDQRRFRALLIALLTVALTTCETVEFIRLGSFQATEQWDLVQYLFGEPILAIDELSEPLLPLVALLHFFVTFTKLKTRTRFFPYRTMLFSLSLTIAIFCSQKSWLLIALLIISSILPWVAIRAQGGSARVYTLYMGVSSVCLVIGYLLLDLSDSNLNLSAASTILLSIAILLRAGIFPFHSWMTDLYNQTSFATASMTVLPMVGIYALMRLLFPITPSWALQSIAILSLITALVAAGIATVQNDLRHFFSYLFLSHSSLVLIGLEIVKPIGITGALCMWVSVGLSLGGFSITLQAIESRLGRISLKQYHGMYNHTPTLAGNYLLMGLATIGFPGTIGFVGLELLIEGAIEISPTICVCIALIAALNSIAIMRVYFRIFTGKNLDTTVQFHSRRREQIANIFFSFLVFIGGIWPQPWVTSRHHAATELLKRRQPGDNQIELKLLDKELLHLNEPVDEGDDWDEPQH